MSGDQIWGIVRTVLATAGGWGVAHGYGSDELMTAILSGAGTIFVAAWSYWSKKPAA